MVDITNTTTKISKTTYLDMYKRYNNYKTLHKVEPKVIYTRPNQQGDYIQIKQFNNMRLRFDNYWRNNGVQPAYVVVKPDSANTTTKTAIHLKLEKALGKTFNTAEELANILKKHPDYQYYYNDMKTPDQTIAALKVVGGAGANCADISQVIRVILIGMGYKNVNIWRGTFRCGGHVWVTYGSDNKIFDAAGMMKYGYPIGRYMCSGTPWDLNKNPAWLISDDGE